MDAKSKSLKAHRARLKKRGMKRLEVSVPAGEAAVIRKAASALRERAAEAARLRQTLGFAPEPGRAANALDLFAMPEPLSAAGEALWADAMAQIENSRKDPALSRPRKFSL
jgi:nucleotidyltransferase/DNA polymerase involved in DNA repair